MKEKSVKNLLSGNKNAAPAEKKKAKGKGGNSGKEDDGTTAAPVLPNAKAKDHDKKGKGKGVGKSMSPEQKKQWPCVFHYTKEGGCLKGKDCPYSHNPKHKHKLDNNKGKGKGDGKAARTPSPQRDGVCYAWREGKCTKGDHCKYKHAKPANPKASAPAPNAKQQAKAQAKPKAAAPAIVRKVHLAMPAITVKRAATSEAKKDDKGAEESEAEVETVYHDRDAEDAMSESSRWSGETDIPEKYVCFQEILDNDVGEEVEYLKNEDEQWRTNTMWYKGFFDDVPQSSSKPVSAKTFKTYDHRRHLACSHKKAIIRAEIMSEVVNDIYRTHKMPMNKERTFTFEYDKEDDEIAEGVVQWKRKHGQPISLFALSANQCKEPIQGSKMADGHRV